MAVNQQQNAKPVFDRKEYAAETARIRQANWLARSKNVDPDASSKAVLFKETEKCVEVNLSALSKEKRRPVWQWIQANRPELAKMIGEDEQFLEFKAVFDCAVKVELPESACRELGLLR